MRKLIPILSLVASLALGAWAYAALPDEVVLRWEAVLPWIPAGAAHPVSSAFAAFGLPTIVLAVWLLLRLLASSVGERMGRRVFPAWLVSARTGAGAVERFGPTFDAIVAAVVAGLLLFHAVMLGTVLGWPAWTPRVFTALVGAGLCAVGNVMPRTRPNWIAGLRTKRTLSDPEVWRLTHRWFGGLLMLTGLATIAASWFAAPVAVLVGLVGSLVSAFVASIVAGRGRAGASGDRASAAIALLVIAVSLPTPAPAQGNAASAPASPSYAEVDKDVPSGGIVLPGTLTVPVGRRGPTLAVIVAGSGPTDRNGNGPLVQTDLYAQLAHQLAEHGVATLRYDKRGIGESARTLDHTALTLGDFVADVMAEARAVATDPRFSRVFLIGHSEGAGLVLQAANRGAPVAGIVIMSGVGRPLREVLHEQFAAAVDSLTVRRIDSAFVRYLGGDDVPDAPEIARPVLVPGYRRLMASMAAYDPEKEMAAVKVPALIVQGGMDIQVGMVDAERLRAAKPSADWLPIVSANHVYKAAAARDAAAQLPLYRDRTIPVVSELPEGIAAWMASAVKP